MIRDLIFYPPFLGQIGIIAGLLAGFRRKSLKFLHFDEVAQLCLSTLGVSRNFQIILFYQKIPS